jgi:hypothetical protein
VADLLRRSPAYNSSSSSSSSGGSGRRSSVGKGVHCQQQQRKDERGLSKRSVIFEQLHEN